MTTQHPPPAHRASVSEEKKKLPTQRRKERKVQDFLGFFAAFAALRLCVGNGFFALTRNKTSEGIQSGRNSMTSNGLITEMHSFFVNAWSARGLGMLRSYPD